MPEQTSTPSSVQTTDVPQVNDSTTVQEQNQTTLPSTAETEQLQPGSPDVNTVKTTDLQVKSGPPAPNAKASSSAMLSIILVGAILIIAAVLFIASLRVSDDKKAKPAIAVGGEENGAMGETKKEAL